MTKYDPLHNAAILCRSALDACSIREGICAGAHHFTDLWARDSLFASLGAIAVGMHTPARCTIDTFIRHQRSDGLIPYRILRSPTTIAKYFGHPRYYRNPKADFRSHQSGGIVPDGGLMTAIAASTYIASTHNHTLAHIWYPRLVKAIDWYDTRTRDGLIGEWFLSEWADAVMKVGQTLYTNSLYYAALDAMVSLARFSRDTQNVTRYSARRDAVSQAIHHTLWNGRYFSDWHDYARHEYLSTHQNLLAVYFGLTSQIEAVSIIDQIHTHVNCDWTIASNTPLYPWWRIPIQNHILGMADYHNGCRWLQPGILYAIALFRTGKRIEARRQLQRIAEFICRHGGVYEVYEQDGTPLRRSVYKSEHSFAWSSGLFLLAHSEIIGKPHV